MLPRPLNSFCFTEVRCFLSFQFPAHSIAKRTENYVFTWNYKTLWPEKSQPNRKCRNFLKRHPHRASIWLNKKNETNRPSKSGRLVQFLDVNPSIGRQMHWLRRWWIKRCSWSRRRRGRVLFIVHRNQCLCLLNAGLNTKNDTQPATDVQHDYDLWSQIAWTLSKFAHNGGGIKTALDVFVKNRTKDSSFYVLLAALGNTIGKTESPINFTRFPGTF